MKIEFKEKYGEISKWILIVEIADTFYLKPAYFEIDKLEHSIKKGRMFVWGLLLIKWRIKNF